MNKNKKGNIEIIFLTCFILATFIILSSIYILYVQINSIIYPIKQDIFYIVQNAYFSINKDKLAYYVYSVDEKILKSKIEELIKLNYPNKNIEISEISYNNDKNTVDIELTLKMDPLILKEKINKISINIKDSIKLKMMEVN